MAATQQPSPRPRAGMQSLEAAIVLEAMHSQRAGLRSGVYNLNPGHAVVPGHSGQQHSHRTRPDRRTSQVTSALHRAGCRRRTGTSWQPKGIGRHPPYPLASPGSRRHYMSSRSMRRVLNRQCSARPSRRSQHGADSANGGQPLHRADGSQSSPCLQPLRQRQQGQQRSHRTRPDRRTSQVNSALHPAGCRRKTGTSWQP